MTYFANVPKDEKPLSEKIFKWGTFKNSAIPTYDVAQAVERLKEHLKKEADKVLLNAGTMLEEWKYPLPLMKKIDEIFGDLK